MRFFWLFAVSSIILAFVIVLAAPGSDANAACNPGRPNTGPFNIWDAWYQWPSGATVYGVKADIEEYDPYVPNPGASSAWVMLQNNDPEPGYYGQIGWKDTPSQNRKLF